MYINHIDIHSHLNFPQFDEDREAIIVDLAVRLYTIGRMLNPLMPTTSKIIKDAVKANKKPENLFGRREE